MHDVALRAFQVSVELSPLAMVLGLALRLTVGAAPLTETVADCVALPPEPLQVNVYVALAVIAPEDCMPLSGLLPDQAPEAAQAVTLVEDHVSVEALPELTVLGAALSVIDGGDPETVTVAVCVAEPPAPVQVN